MTSFSAKTDEYRNLTEEDIKNTTWRFGVPPNYDAVNKLFEEGRTKIWPPGSLEEQVQTLVKTFEMEMVHKVDNIKSVDTDKFRYVVNERKPMTREDIRKVGGIYNADLQSSLPENMQIYNPAEETSESSHQIFTTAFPRGFALEVLHVYSGPPHIAFKFRHWGFKEGPFKGHAPTGEKVEFYGIAIFEVNEQFKVVKVEFFYDRGELLGPLVKGESINDQSTTETLSSCPFIKNTG